MAVSLRDKAARRAGLYQQMIAAKQTAGDFKAGVHEANRWLLEELAKVRKQRPADADAVDAEVTRRLADLAAAIPGYKPARKKG